MKNQRLALGLLVTATMSAAVVLGRVNEPAGQKMTTAAQKLLNGLSGDLREQATFAFDDPERINWHYIPRERKGAVLKAMTDEQKGLVKDLLRAGTSDSGYKDALNVMALEAILRDIEGTERARLIRDPELYYVSVFGKPSATGVWGWRCEGHHLSLNYVIKDGKVIGDTPIFFGANPAKVPSGPRKGFRALPQIEDVARKLYKSLDGAAKRKATLAAQPPRDVESGTQKARAEDLPMAGLAFADMTKAQQQTLRDLIKVYLGRYPKAVGAELMREIADAGMDKVHFGWYGPAEPGKPHAYRVQGPTFIIEYNNTQNGANHCHSLYRLADGDFAIQAVGR